MHSLKGGDNHSVAYCTIEFSVVQFNVKRIIFPRQVTEAIQCDCKGFNLRT